MYELALFAGAGGGILGGRIHGWQTICAVELEEFPARVLQARCDDGFLPPFPIWDNIKTFRADNPETSGMFRLLKAIASNLVISGGFPCQDISSAGKGRGITGDKSGLYFELERIVFEIRPAYVFMENSPMLIHRGFECIIEGFQKMGYDLRWCTLGAHHVGAPHIRDRLWILAYPAVNRCEKDGKRESVTASETRLDKFFQEERKNVMGNGKELPERKQAIKTESESACRQKGDVTCSSGEYGSEMGDTVRGGCHGQFRGRPGTKPPNRHSESEKKVSDGKDRNERLSIGEEKKQPKSGISCKDGCGKVFDGDGQGLQKRQSLTRNYAEKRTSAFRGDLSWWRYDPAGRARSCFGPSKSVVGRMAHGVACRVDRIKAIGNGQVPAVAALAWEILNGGIGDE